MIKLHDFYRSSASFRVRIALNLKDVPYERVAHDLDHGAHREHSYIRVNPQGLLPSLEIDGAVLTQSLAIIEYLDARYAQLPLLPPDELGRARVRALFQLIAADTHPITGMRLGRYLKDSLQHSDADLRRWQHHWLAESFTALEALLTASADTGRFSHGEHPTLADIALVPQVYSAKRQHLAFDAWPTVSKIYDTCLSLPAFKRAHPDSH